MSSQYLNWAPTNCWIVQSPKLQKTSPMQFNQHKWGQKIGRRQCQFAVLVLDEKLDWFGIVIRTFLHCQNGLSFP